MSLPSFSVRNHVLVNMLMMTLLAAGVVFAMTLRREMFPESRPDKLLVSAIYPGVQPEDVQKSVTVKIEEAVRGLEGIDTVESMVGEGVSFTTLTLLSSVDDPDVLLQEVRNEIDSLQDIPDDVEKITLRKVEPQLPVIAIAVYGDASEEQLKTAAQDLRDELLLLPGVSRVVLNGIREDEIYIDVRPDRLLEFDVTFEEVAAAIRQSNIDISGGTLRGDRSSIAVRTLGESQEATPLENIVVRSESDGRRILVSDVATVFDGFVDVELKTLFNGKPVVDCVVFKAKDEDAVQIASVVKTYIAARKGQPYDGPGPVASVALGLLGKPNLHAIHTEARKRPMPETLSYSLHTDIARFVEGRLDLMTRNGAAGLVLVLISLNLFLNWRVAWWAAVGLVVSFLGTFVVMWMLGASMNLLSMFGMIIVLGIIVDDAIVIGENIYRHVEEGMPPLKAAVHGAEEVMWPVIVAVATTVGAFAPLFFIQGQIGDFMSQLPLVVIAALSISLIEALIILPAHLRHLPKPALSKTLLEDETADHQKPGFFHQIGHAVGHVKQHVLTDWLQRPYTALLRLALRWRYLTVTIAVSLFILSAGMLFSGVVKVAFIQDMDSESVICSIEMPIGTTSERLEDQLKRLTDYIVESGEFPEVVNVQTIAGRQYDLTGAGSVGFEDQSHLGQVVVELCPADERTRSSETLTNMFREFSTDELAGVNSVRWVAMSGGPGGNDIEILLSGSDSEELERATMEMSEVVGQFAGVFDIDDNMDLGKKEAKLRLLDSATATGITVGQLGMHVRGALFGQEARRLSRDREDVRIMVRYPEEFRSSVWNIESMWIPSPGMSGSRAWIPMKEVAEIEEDEGYSALHRYQQNRSVTIFGAIDDKKTNGQPKSQVLAAIRKKYEDDLASKYPGVSIQFLGQAQEMAKAFGSLTIAFPIAFLIIFGMLAGLFRSYTQPLVVMSAIPFGFLGAVFGHWLTGETFTILSWIGLVALSGILVNDSLVLVDFINKRVRDGLTLHEASVDGAKKRLRAILLTTLTTAAGLTPLMFETSFQAKFLIPMAVTLTFGLLAATALTLIIVPCLNLIREDILHFFGFQSLPD